MDPLIAPAARALSSGDPLGALKLIALREDAPALALRGIAMAQLGDFIRAKALLRRAERAFGKRDVVARARCVVAGAEIALASRDLGWSEVTLAAAAATLDAHNDHVNAAHARYLGARRLLLIGRIDEAERAVAALGSILLPPALRAALELVVAGIAIRRIRVKSAHEALGRASRAARTAGIPALQAEIDHASRVLRTPAARVIARDGERDILLDQVEMLFASPSLVVDACRNVARAGNTTITLATRPVLFAIVRALAESWPDDVARNELIRRAFGSKFTDESHRARLRVEITRLRSAMRHLADIRATRQGFALVPLDGRNVVVMAPLVDDEHSAVLALLADGEAWSSSALALALGRSQRSVQRALDALAEVGNVQFFGRGRARRWITPPTPALTTGLLLPSPLPTG
jgi:hypothetical protein